MFNRTFGWVQNPSDFKKLKKTVQIFNSTSTHYQDLKNRLIREQIIYFDDIANSLQNKMNNNIETFNYSELVGSSLNKEGTSAKTRAEAEANALIQISCLPQQWKKTNKRYIDNWTSDGFLRWAVSLNFLHHDRDTDLFTMTELGREFSESIDESEEEKEILTRALLSYPPATQVLNILEGNPGYKTKFFIGEQLGFRGEKGFTSYDEALMIDWLKNAAHSERSKIRSDVEGTSDKYARMICMWLKKLDLVSSHSKEIIKGNERFSNFTGFTITAKGSHAIRQANGGSRNSRVVKFVKWEFLATIANNRDYVRTRRAYILKYLQETQSFSVLIRKLREIGFTDNEQVIKNDITGLNYFGIRINKEDNRIVLLDIISDFSIPKLEVTEILKDAEGARRKEHFMRTTELEPKYIELLDIAYDGNRDRDFEMITAELFRKVYGLNSKLLGGARKPDSLVYTANFGIIIDTKAYSNGYSKSIIQADQMIRYIEDNQRRDVERNPTEWWTDFDANIPNDEFYYLWISSEFVGKFLEQLNYTSTQTNTRGGALNVEQLLLGADAVLKGNLDPNTLPNYIKDEEVYFEEI